MKYTYKIVLKNGTKKEYKADALAISGDWLYVVDVPESAEEKLQGAGHKAGFAADMIMYWEREEIRQPEQDTTELEFLRRGKQ